MHSVTLTLIKWMPAGWSGCLCAFHTFTRLDLLRQPRQCSSDGDQAQALHQSPELFPVPINTGTSAAPTHSAISPALEARL
ncbi:unnamed protein product [Leuciscus chuanchicus]